MNKTEINYITGRVDDIAKCINGHAATIAEEHKKKVSLSMEDIIEQINSGKATLRADAVREDDIYFASGYESMKALTRLFKFDLSGVEEGAEKHNKRIEDKLNEFQLEIELEAKRIIDRVVLGLSEMHDLPGMLERFSLHQNDFVL